LTKGKKNSILDIPLEASGRSVVGEWKDSLKGALEEAEKKRANFEKFRVEVLDKVSRDVVCFENLRDKKRGVP
jgi:hypothetical protein